LLSSIQHTESIFLFLFSGVISEVHARHTVFNRYHDF